MTICKLCLQEKKLIGRSHIIPDFLYKHSGLYDEKHRMHDFTIEDLLDGKKPTFPQSGVHEGNILCADCDNRLLGVNLENYAKKALYGGGKLPIEETPHCTNYTDTEEQIFSICSNLNYTKFKLFLLSILWRASISSKHFFRRIDLGEHEEIVREMILNMDAKSFSDYPIFVFTTASDKQFTSDMIIEPKQFIGNDGMETCCFIIGGFIYTFKIGVHTGNQEDLRTQTINEENKLTVLHTQPGKTIELIKNYLGF